MKIVRILPVLCLLSLLAACSSDSITGPAESPAPATAAMGGSGTFGSGN